LNNTYIELDIRKSEESLKMAFGDPYKEYEEIAEFNKKSTMLSLKEIVYVTISRLCNKRGRFIGPTYEDVIAYIESRYEERYSRRSIEKAIEDLESEGHVYRMRGLLRDGRVVLLTTKEVERVVFTLLKLTEKEALVHDDVWEGKVYDPPYDAFHMKDVLSPSVPSWWPAVALIGGMMPIFIVGAIVIFDELMKANIV
jgi:hypothetical protein